MSDQDAPDEPSLNDLQAQLRIARKEAKEAGEKAALADQVARENAFLKAGIDPDDPKAKWLYKGYDGEMTKDAILQAAQAAGVIEAPKPDPAGEAMSRVADVAGGADSGDQQAAYRSEVAAATSVEQVMAIAERYGKVTSYSVE